MKRLLKLLLGLLALLFVAAAGLVVAVVNVNPNEYKGWISERFEARTGRSLALNGNLDLSFYPWLGVEAHDVTMGNAAGFGSKPFLHADFAKVRVKLLPLLQKHYEVDTVQLHGLVLNLAVNKNGMDNWSDLAGPGPRQSQGLPLAAVAFGGVDIKNAAVHWNNQATGARYDLTAINASTGKLVYGEPIKLNVSLAARANRPALMADVKLTGTLHYDLSRGQYGITPLQLRSTLRGPKIPGSRTDLDLDAAVQADLDKDTAAVTDLKMSVLGTRASGMIRASRIRTATPAVETRLDVSGEDLALPFQVLEIQPLASQLAGLARRSYSLSTRVDADLKRGDVNVPEFKAHLLGADIQGSVKATNIHSDTPAAHGSLTAGGPDLPTLLQVLGQFQTGKDRTLARYGRQLQALPDKAFTVNTTFDADLGSGDINVPALSADALGIHLAGNLKATDMQSGSGAMQGRLSLDSAHLGPLLTALDKPDLGKSLRSMSLETVISGNRVDLNLKPLALKLALAGKEVPGGAASVVLNAATHVNLEKQQLDLDDFSIAGLGLDVGGQLHVTDLKKAPAYQGKIRVAPFDLRKLMRDLHKPPPATANKNALGKVALQTNFSGNTGKLALGGLALTLDQSSIKGNLAVHNFKKPAVTANLDVDRINLDDYLPPAAADKPVTPETAAGAATALPVKTLRALNADVDVKAGALTVSGLKLSDVVLHLKGKDGRITLDPARARLYQGSYAGSIQINANGKLPKLALNSTLKNVQMEPLLKDFTRAPARLRGTGTLSLDVSATGRNTAAMKRVLNGTARLDVNKGVLVGIDVRKVLAQAEIMLESKRLGKIEKGGETPFDKLSASFNIKSGIVDNHDLVITAPGFKVTGQGMVASLRNNTVKYDMSISVDRSRVTRGQEAYNLGGYSIPVACRGSLKSPSCQPDYDVLLKEAGKRKLQEILNRALGGKQQSSGTTQQKNGSSQQQTQPKKPGDALKNAIQKGLQDILK